MVQPFRIVDPLTLLQVVLRFMITQAGAISWMNYRYPLFRRCEQIFSTSDSSDVLLLSKVRNFGIPSDPLPKVM